MHIKEALEYRDGKLWWKVSGSGRVLGKPAGCINTDGYVQIGFGGKFYVAHRLIWLLVYGCWPKNFIDHINRNRADNRLENLREASARINSLNTARSDNRELPKNIYVAGRKFQVTVSIKGKRHTLPVFATLEEAIEARDGLLNGVE